MLNFQGVLVCLVVFRFFSLSLSSFMVGFIIQKFIPESVFFEKKHLIVFIMLLLLHRSPCTVDVHFWAPDDKKHTTQKNMEA